MIHYFALLYMIVGVSNCKFARIRGQQFTQFPYAKHGRIAWHVCGLRVSSVLNSFSQLKTIVVHLNIFVKILIDGAKQLSVRYVNYGMNREWIIEGDGLSQVRSGSSSCTTHRLPNLAPLPVSGDSEKFNRRRFVSSEASHKGRQMNKRNRHNHNRREKKWDWCGCE